MNHRDIKLSTMFLKHPREGQSPDPQGSKKQRTVTEFTTDTGAEIKLGVTAEEAVINSLKSLIDKGLTLFSQDHLPNIGEERPRPYSHKMTSTGIIIAMPAGDNKQRQVGMWEYTIHVLMALLGKNAVQIVLADPAKETPTIPLSDTDRGYLKGIGNAVTNFDKLSLNVNNSGSVESMTESAIMHLAAIRFIEDKERRGNCQPASLPVNPVNGGSPAAFLEARHKAFKQALGDNAYIADTIHALVKMLAEGMRLNAEQPILQLKISWSAILKAAGLTKITSVKPKRGPARQLMQVVLPVNPAKSAYLLTNEKTHWGNFFAHLWGIIEVRRKEFKDLPSPARHERFNAFVKEMQDKAAEMRSIADTVGRRLGHRKRHIDELIKSHNIKVKKDASAPERTAAATQNKDHLHALPKEVKWIFSPFYAFGDKEGWSDIRNNINNVSVADAIAICEIKPANEQALPALKITKNWLVNFNPDLRNITLAPTPAEAAGVEQLNPFHPLAGGLGDEMAT